MTKKSYKILSAEDDIDDQYFIRESIKRSGIRANVEFVSDGYALIKKLLSCPDNNLPDFILMDMYMPLMNGVVALHMIKKHEKIKNIPVVFLTASSNRDDIDLCCKLGATLIITKSDSLDELAESLRSIDNEDIRSENSPCGIKSD